MYAHGIMMVRSSDTTILYGACSVELIITRYFVFNMQESFVTKIIGARSVSQSVNISKPRRSDAGKYVCRATLRYDYEVIFFNVSGGFLNVYRKLKLP